MILWKKKWICTYVLQKEVSRSIQYESYEWRLSVCYLLALRGNWLWPRSEGGCRWARCRRALWWWARWWAHGKKAASHQIHRGSRGTHCTELPHPHNLPRCTATLTQGNLQHYHNHYSNRLYYYTNDKTTIFLYVFYLINFSLIPKSSEYFY